MSRVYGTPASASADLAVGDYCDNIEFTDGGPPGWGVWTGIKWARVKNMDLPWGNAHKQDGAYLKVDVGDVISVAGSAFKCVEITHRFNEPPKVVFKSLVELIYHKKED